MSGSTPITIRARAKFFAVALLLVMLGAMLPTSASADVAASVDQSLTLGLTDASSSEVLDEMAVESRFGLDSDDATPSADEIGANLPDAAAIADGAAGTIALINIPKPVAPKPVAVAKKRTTSTSGWRTARVSWYGPGFYGDHTADGSVLERDSMFLANRTLPFGTKVAIKYKGRTVVGVVHDRGPYVASRQFDLGPGVAKALGFSGVGTVSYMILGK